MTELSTLDRSLLERVQAQFPLVPRSYAALAQSLGLEETEVLERIQKLKAAGMIREISAIFDTRCLGYQTTLVAFHAASDSLENVAAEVSAHAGVSHNYARPHHYNLWFTLAVPPGVNLVQAVERIARGTGVDDWLNLPALRVFKIRTHFKMVQGGDPTSLAGPEGPTLDDRPFTSADIPYVRALQQDLALVPRPFAGPAGWIGTSEEELLAKARELQAAGIMRRFGAVLRHRKVGYRANGMACWAVLPSRIEEAGRRAAEYPQVSHCYQRPAYPPSWPYSLFTMIHGQSKGEVEAIVTQLAQETEIEEYKVLYSTREFKKERVRYFEEEA
jgi:DNA-binding Lrp family transcriptional regulator